MDRGRERNAVPDPKLVPARYRVARLRRELRDTYTLELIPLDAPAPAFAPGQFAMLYAFGVGEAPISISGDPARPGVLVHTVRAVGAVTRALCRLRPGAVVGVRGPFGRPWPVVEAEGSDIVLVAGGLGVAPLRPVVHHILAQRERYGRVVLLYGARSPQDILYRQQLTRWRGRLDLEVAITVDSAPGGWRGQVGVVTTLIPRASFDPSETVGLVCGPEVMMRFTLRELLQRGVPPDRLFLSMERSMQCAVRLCGHCQFGPAFVCADGPVFPYSAVASLLAVREV
jgi:NAD(P)H-flavin reductase